MQPKVKVNSSNTDVTPVIVIDVNIALLQGCIVSAAVTF